MMRMQNFTKMAYEAPLLETTTIVVEQGFTISGGSTIDGAGQDDWDQE